MVTRVSDDPLASARELAAEIAAKSPDAVRAAKRLYDAAWNGPAEETLALEAELQLGLIGSPNQLAAVTAGFTRSRRSSWIPEFEAAVALSRWSPDSVGESSAPVPALVAPPHVSV